MNQHLSKNTPEQMVEAIFALDLDPIKFKLMDTKEGHGWSREKVDAVELEYRRFLALTAKYPDQVIAPNTEVDKFWHGHILDTMKYAEDCEQVFGYFLHHFPYFGMRDEEDAANLANAADVTRKLYEKEFGPAAAAEASAYCAKTSAYCAKTAAYCAKTAAYCAVASAKPADSAYCAKAGAPQAAYCAVSASKKDGAYCAVAAASYCAVVTAKGRPRLQPVQAAG